MPDSQRTNNIYLLFMFVALLLTACQKKLEESATISTDGYRTSFNHVSASPQPNVIMFLADDIGYEVPTYSGGQSYSTPNLDTLALNGIQFSHCFATPDCCPSRVELLSGKYSVRNYIDWGIYDLSQKTFVNYLKDAGYTTCVAGKWQFGNGDMAARQMGFDKYLLFDAFKDLNEQTENTERYKNPLLYENGAYLPKSKTDGKYADDLFVDYINNFIDSNKNKPFFIYYPLSLCHAPFSPTPDDPEFATWNPQTDKSNSKYFPSMVKYMDKKVGEVVNKINATGLNWQNNFCF